MGSTTTSETKSEMDPFQKEMLEDLYGRTTEIADTPFAQYTGDLVAGLDPMMQQAYEGYGALTLPSEYGAASDIYAGMAAETPEQRMASVRGYQDMYTEGVIDPMLAQAERKRAQERVGEAAGITKAGAFGNVRRGVFEGEREAAYETSRDAMVAGLMQQGLSFGEAQVAAENQARMAGAQGMMGAAGAGRQAELGALGAQMSAGGLMRGVEQEGLGSAYEQFMREQQYPLQALTGLFSTAGLIPAGIGTTTGSSYDPYGGMKAFGQLLHGAGSAGQGYEAYKGTSDVRLKDNIVPQGSVNGVNFYTWDWNDAAKKSGLNEGITFGVMAQELEKSHPELVVVGDHGYRMVNYAGVEDITGVRAGG